ncbi:hypothetical protein BGX23_005381 [Mortierella sp. AD031]|nr:hypothetical protein BGX23_005381 [Mortierella sp. AD031]
MTHPAEDMIAPHSDSLCQQFNHDHPSTVLNMARFFIGGSKNASVSKNVVSARVVQVRQDGLLMEGQTLQGKSFKLSVSFLGGSMQSLDTVRESFAELGKQANRGMAQTTTTATRRRQIPGQPEGWRVYWPKWNPFLVTLAASVSSFFYIYFFPDTKIPLLQWTKNKVGYDTVRSCVHFAVFLHSFQTSTAIYLMRRVSAYRFSLRQQAVWTGCVQFMGIGSMLKLLPIVYNSKFVHDEMEKEEGYYLEEEREEMVVAECRKEE